jgi:hypothetical protein
MAKLTKAQRAWAFYENEIYDTDYLKEYKLFDDTREIFNPVPKTAFIMNALTMQQEINPELNEKKTESESESENEDNAIDNKLAKINDIWDYNNFQNQKYMLALWLILSKEAVVELNKRDDEIIFVIHDPDLVETEYMGGEMVYCKIEGTTKQFDMEEKSFNTVDVTKEYYNVRNETGGYKAIVETVDGKESETPLAFDFIPVVEFSTDYDMGPLFNKTDYYNLLEAYLENVFYLHGDPLIWDNLKGEMSEEGKEKHKEGRFKEQSVWHLNNPDAQMQYLEMSGNVAELMLKKQEDIKKNISNDYPEYVLSTLLSNGDPSGDALKIKSIEIEAKVGSLRGDLETGIVDIDNKALLMLGKSPVQHGIGFGGILPDSVKQLLDLVKGLREIGFISRETGMEQFPDLITNPKKENKRIKAERNETREEIDRELSDDAHSQD